MLVLLAAKVAVENASFRHINEVIIAALNGDRCIARDVLLVFRRGIKIRRFILIPVAKCGIIVWLKCQKSPLPIEQLIAI